MEFVLNTVDGITWWKSLSVFMRVGWVNSEVLRIETKDSVHHAEGFLQPFQMLEYARIDLWKGGFLGFGAYVLGWDFNAWANRGRRLVFTWQAD
ncbi:hypothetical protein ACFT4A_23035 [Streptomyces sp. NPDC057099]|uniref:hypothetical protein n=1 Tax=Streptomyces sp. NPDC057099 TaxID=3346019 RepID=UPI0036344DFF